MDDLSDQRGLPRSSSLQPGAEAGLYRSTDEHDACGVGFVAHIKGHRSHSIVRQALDLLVNLEHRGASGSDPDTGDGAGILVQMPDKFLRKTVNFLLPSAGAYGAGLVFLPGDLFAIKSAFVAAHPDAVVALSDVTVERLEQQRLREAFQTDPEIGIQIKF